MNIADGLPALFILAACFLGAWRDARTASRLPASTRCHRLPPAGGPAGGDCRGTASPPAEPLDTGRTQR